MITESAKPESAENGRPEPLFGCLFCCNLNICGHDGIGRHARFRFSCSDALGFESPCPHHEKSHFCLPTKVTFFNDIRSLWNGWSNETSYWLKLMYETKRIDTATSQYAEKLCGNIRRLLIASCKRAKENAKWKDMLPEQQSCLQ